MGGEEGASPDNDPFHGEGGKKKIDEERVTAWPLFL